MQQESEPFVTQESTVCAPPKPIPGMHADSIRHRRAADRRHLQLRDVALKWKRVGANCVRPISPPWRWRFQPKGPDRRAAATNAYTEGPAAATGYEEQHHDTVPAFGAASNAVAFRFTNRQMVPMPVAR